MDNNQVCILTIIKNEQQYLEEWIKYHLNLGINHIFIFEDINSDSHKEITDKYKNVSLISVEQLNVEKYIQGYYMKHGLQYIKDNYNYDWCFVIDIDEYITPETGIHNIMQQFKDYDAVILQWQNYGANGLIYKPDYKDKGIIETYTKEFGISPKDGESKSVKTVYNLHTYNKDLFISVHTPSKKVKWCKTNFGTDIKEIVYDKVYLRHYFTKSFEEYVWKVYVRGMFSKKYRNYDDFFITNPDMLDRKEELLKLADEIIKKYK